MNKLYVIKYESKPIEIVIHKSYNQFIEWNKEWTDIPYKKLASLLDICELGVIKKGDVLLKICQKNQADAYLWKGNTIWLNKNFIDYLIEI